MNVIITGFYGEGTTDERFLPSIIQRTVEEIARECPSQLEVYRPVILNTRAETFASAIVEVAHQAVTEGVLILCIHTDADAATDQAILRDKIAPAWAAVEVANLASCPALVAVVPVHMSEAWILADKALLKEELGTDHSDHDLGLSRAPEAYANPKAAIEEAIRRAFEHRSRRHRQQVTIGDLYQPLGQSISLDKLAVLPSYQKFQENIRQAFRQLNYLH